ncbi:MAG TPA: hypothetical protein VGE60_11050 [Telluria sp.]
MKANSLVAGTLLMAMLTGCATSRSSFYADPRAVGDAEICRTLAGDAVRADGEFEHALRTELRLRGISESECGAIVERQNVAIGVGALIGAVVVAAAASGHGGHHHGADSYVDIAIDVPVVTASVENQWDWDQYHNASGNLVWGCRGVHTRELALPEKCDGREMVDYRWPAKNF